MAADYFAHAAYGVELDGKQLKILGRLLNEAEDALEIADPDDFDDLESSERRDRMLSWIVTNRPGQWADFLVLIGAPEGAHLIWTGSEDDRPGRCATQPETWIIGYGVYAFPREISEEFAKRADWHNWVECG